MEATMEVVTTLALGKMTFFVQKREGIDKTHNRPVYQLTGKRGARYFTMRNYKQPDYMFVVNLNGGTTPFDGKWLTDKNGKLEVI